MDDRTSINKAMTECTIGILAPMANKENTQIFRDEKNNKIFVKVVAPTDTENLFNNVDFSFEEEFCIDERYSVSTTECTIKDGIIAITIKTNKDIKVIPIS